MTSVPGARPPAVSLRRLTMSPRLSEASQTWGPLTALLALILFNALFTDQFLTMQSMRVNVTQVSTTIIVGVGMTLVIATGGIDLSVGSLMAISGAIAPLIFMSDRGPLEMYGWLANITAFVVAIVVAGLFGMFNGFLVAG